MTKEQRNIYNELFTKYGNKSDMGEIRIIRTFYNAKKIYNADTLARYDEWAGHTIEQLEKALEQIKTYRIAIFEQFNKL